MAKDVSDLVAEAQPTKIKVGNEEYSPEELENIVSSRNKLEQDNKLLQADYTKKSQKLSEYEKLSKEETEETPLVTQDYVTKEELTSTVSKIEKRLQLENQIDQWCKDNSFVNKDQLVKYLDDRAANGTVLTIEDATTLLYPDQIAKKQSPPKPETLPAFDKSSTEPPRPTTVEPGKKIPDLMSKEMSQLLSEGIKNAIVEE